MIEIVSGDEIRIGDAERKAAADRLGDELVSGRLTPDEHEERLDAVLAAKTQKELAVPFTDLPAIPQGRSPAVAPAASPDIWNRLMAGSSGIALVAFFILGFGFNGWAWAWLVFLVPGIIASMANAGERRR